MRLVIAAVLLGLVSTGDASAEEIRGVVKFAGKAPERAKIDRSAEPRCPQDEPAEDVVVTDGKLQDVVVRVIKGPKRALDREFAVPTEPVVIDQSGCAYRPRVSVARRGQELEVRNSDPLFHNVRGVAGESVAFNLPQPAKGKPIVRELEDEVTALKCDVHPWMAAWVVRVEHPYVAVTGADGAFVLKDLVPGSYTVEAWHPTLGRQTTKVVVKKGKKPAKATLTFRAAK
jgi:hypothetical protein